MTEHTYDSVLSLIYDADPESRERAVFTCGPETLRDLRRIHDGDGRYMVEGPMQKNEPPRMFGFPVLEKIGHGGLTFGPETTGEELKFFLHPNQWDAWVAIRGQEWVERNCELVKPLPISGRPNRTASDIRTDNARNPE